MQDTYFDLYTYNESVEIVEMKYCGGWLIVDNGCLDWSTTITPMKETMYDKDTRRSEWMESMRKDVECTFVIIKEC